MESPIPIHREADSEANPETRERVVTRDLREVAISRQRLRAIDDAMREVSSGLRTLRRLRHELAV
jgi:hypothetical protein